MKLVWSTCHIRHLYQYRLISILGIIHVEHSVSNFTNYVHSIFDDVVLFILSFTSLDHSQRKVLSLRHNPIFPRIFAPSIPPNEKQATNVLNPALTTPRLPKMNIGVAAAYRYPRVSAELTCSEHCSVPRSGRTAVMSFIPSVIVEPISAPLEDMAR